MDQQAYDQMIRDNERICANARHRRTAERLTEEKSPAQIRQWLAEQPEGEEKENIRSHLNQLRRKGKK